jgi:uncharacterized FAD-dependent dehydrogenase
LIENTITTTQASTRSVSSHNANFALLVSLSVCHLLDATR